MNIRTVILSVVLVLILLFAAQLVTAKTEEVSKPSSSPASGFEIQERPADLENTASISSYRSQFGECFDVAIMDLAACRDASLASVQEDRSPIDECFDESISEVASCRKASQATDP